MRTVVICSLFALYTKVTQKSVSKSQPDRFILNKAPWRFDKHIANSIRGYDYLQELRRALAIFHSEELDGSRHRLFQRGAIASSPGPKPEAPCLGRIRRSRYRRCWFKDQWFSKRARNLSYKKADARTYSGYKNLSVVFSLFTLQFLPERDRLPLVTKIYRGLNEGGAFILSEKFHAKNAQIAGDAQLHLLRF